MHTFRFTRIIINESAEMEVVHMATNKRVFTLRLSDEVFDKIGMLATSEHRSITNYIEYVLLKHLDEIEENTEPDAGIPK